MISNMYEKFKEDIETTEGFEYNGREHIKQSYLNAIDVMIEWEDKKNGEQAYCIYESYECKVCKLDINNGSGMCNYNYPTETVEYLQEQRKLIEDHE